MIQEYLKTFKTNKIVYKSPQGKPVHLFQIVQPSITQLAWATEPLHIQQNDWAKYDYVHAKHDTETETRPQERHNIHFSTTYISFQERSEDTKLPQSSCLKLTCVMTTPLACQVEVPSWGASPSMDAPKWGWHMPPKQMTLSTRHQTLQTFCGFRIIILQSPLNLYSELNVFVWRLLQVQWH